jgi:ABC-type transport system involved in cytochrome bd biosynthesis fused ATPase/permease subunit
MYADLVRNVRRWIAAGPSIALVAIVFAFVNPLISLLIYLALLVLLIAFNPVDSYFERLREDEV